MIKQLVIILLLMPLFFTSCEKDEKKFPEEVKTISVTEINSASAYVNAQFLDIKCPSNPKRGVCWSTSTNPTIANNKTEDAVCSGAQNWQLTGLTPKTKYYVRAYVTSSTINGILYGNELSFTTL